MALFLSFFNKHNLKTVLTLNMQATLLGISKIECYPASYLLLY